MVAITVNSHHHTEGQQEVMSDPSSCCTPKKQQLQLLEDDLHISEPSESSSTAESTACSSFAAPEEEEPEQEEPVSEGISNSSSSSHHLRRFVKFNKIVHNRRIPHLNDLTREEVEATWIQPEEYLEIRAYCVETVKKMMSTPDGEWIDNEQHCRRGLEGKTRTGSALRRAHKLDSVAAVLEEQSLQWNEDIEDEEAIMEVYSVFSAHCSENAQFYGLQDELAATLYQQEPCRYESSSSSSPQTPSEMQDIDVDSTTRSSITVAADVVMGKLKDIMQIRGSRAAVLKDIEKHYYEESSIERRRYRDEVNSSTTNTSALASFVRDYFSVKNLPREEVEEQAAAAPVDVTFTSHLNDVFHSRKRRQALLESIEHNGYFIKPTIETTGAGATIPARRITRRNSKLLQQLPEQQQQESNVNQISQSLGDRLKEIFSSRKIRSAVLNELGSSSHMRGR